MKLSARIALLILSFTLLGVALGVALPFWQAHPVLALAVAMGVGLLAVWATRRLTLPVRQLTRSVQRIAAGEPHGILATSGSDEVGELASAFQTLLNTLNASYLALKNLAASLEEQVQQRTVDLAVLRDQALEASQAKSVFLATMSHEIRTPMNVIQGMLELLRTAEISLPDRERVELAFGASTTLLTLINNVLDFSKMDAEQLSLDSVNFDLRQLVYEAAMTVAPLAHAKEIELTAYFPDIACALVRGDPIRLKQIFINLLGNAIKFTPEGGSVELHGGPVSSDATTFELLFEVRDSGVGVSAEDREKIFSRFTQADSSSTRRHEGTGLGLSICKHLVQMMHGEIDVVANPSARQGSVFYFTVQLGRQKQPDPQSEKALSFDGMRVLAVAHDGLLRTLVEDALIPHGAHLDHVGEAEHASLLLQQADELRRSYHLVICNRRPGAIYRRELRQLLSCASELRFILLTDLLDQGWDQATELPGTTICIKKPINADRLLAAVEWLMTNQGSHQARAASGRPPALAQDSFSPQERELVRAEGAILIVDDQAANLVVTRGMLGHLGYRPEQISTAIHGQEALDLCRQKGFDLILMDCQMPVMDGFTATRAIHAWQEAQGQHKVPIVAFTADVTPQSRDNIRACGMVGFLSKPVSMTDLRTQLRQFSLLVPTRSATPLPERGETDGESGGEQGTEIDMDLLLKSMGSIGLQEEDFREVADLLAVQFQELLHALQRNIEQSDEQAARAVAHVIKGSMANTIFPVLQKPTRALYEAVREQQWSQAIQALALVNRLFQPIQETLLAYLAGENGTADEQISPR
ncbi:MAG: ATP-binding protein [Magnetococcus sp. MYC-9]